MSHPVLWDSETKRPIVDGKILHPETGQVQVRPSRTCYFGPPAVDTIITDLSTSTANGILPLTRGPFFSKTSTLGNLLAAVAGIFQKLPTAIYLTEIVGTEYFLRIAYKKLGNEKVDLRPGELWQMLYDVLHGSPQHLELVDDDSTHRVHSEGTGERSLNTRWCSLGSASISPSNWNLPLAASDRSIIRVLQTINKVSALDDIFHVLSFVFIEEGYISVVYITNMTQVAFSDAVKHELEDLIDTR